jgi:hypothetical protein
MMPWMIFYKPCERCDNAVEEIQVGEGVQIECQGRN